MVDIKRKATEIKRKMGIYETRRPQTSAQPQQFEKKWLHPILPSYWDVFHAHNEKRREQGLLPSDFCYDVGIFLVGFRSIPIVLSLAEIHPRAQIYFLYSRDTRPMLGEIADRIAAMLPESDLRTRVKNAVGEKPNFQSDFAVELADPSDPVETFKRIKEIVNRVDSDKRIALDLTGGKKTMISGGFTAGTILGGANFTSSACDMFYVDAETYDSHRHAPEPGTEFLSQLKNPLDIYNWQTRQKAEDFFDGHNYEVAANLWGDVKKNLDTHAKRYGLDAELEAVQASLEMANCYRFWDAFDYEASGDLKGKWGYDEKHVYRSIDVLDILSVVCNRQTLFEDDTRVIHYAVDRYQNAIRRQTSGKLDDAMVRFTQVVEILCNYRIYQIAKAGHLRHGSRAAVSIVPDKRWNLSPLIKILFGSRPNKANRQSYKISDAEERWKVTDFGYESVNDITASIGPRNDFIHLNSSMNQEKTKEDAEKLQRLARKFLENFSRSYCAENGLTFETLLELHELCWE